MCHVYKRFVVMFVTDDGTPRLDAILRATPLLEGEVRSEPIEKASSVSNIPFTPTCRQEAANCNKQVQAASNHLAYCDGASILERSCDHDALYSGSEA